MLVLNNHEQTTDIAKTNIKAKGTPDFSKTATTDEGLFMAEDDEGESYYYRGAVKNNYVSFAGFIWRIIRRNGDGSIRMIYSGKKTSDTGEATTIGNSAFNDKYWDPAYEGYKYNEKFSLHENNAQTGYDWFTNTTKYNFGTGYIFDESIKKFTLTGTIKQLTWKDNHAEIVSNNLYSCLNTECNVIYKVMSYQNDKTMKVMPISYSSVSYIDATENNINSSMKNTLDVWYKNNLIDYTSYIANEAFCNDRSVTSGSGYLLSPNTIYGAYERLYNNKIPSIKCINSSDAFSLTNINAKLDYPIGIITADEEMMAGSIYETVNNTYYLYNGIDNWTMSPAITNSYDSRALVWYNHAGILSPWRSVPGLIGVRPVINLKSDVLITKGDGSSLSPFIVES